MTVLTELDSAPRIERQLALRQRLGGGAPSSEDQKRVLHRFAERHTRLRREAARGDRC